jgi:EAL domain-containing protein (putative c-di-GMP-specific phosphodiesterase class I)/GGDEF domain-containing protein
VVLGAGAQARFGVSPSTFRLQAVMFAGAMAALFAGAAIAGEARTRRSAREESLRWRALVQATPAVVARVEGDGRWRVESPAQGRPDAEALDIVARASRIPEVVGAAAAGRSATVQWGPDDETGRRFVTHLTPLSDGDSLAVTTETTRLDGAELALAWERSHDRETDLPNRDLLLATADQANTDGTSAESSPASLIVIDVDGATRRANLVEADPVRVVLVLAERIRGQLDQQALAQGRSLVARIGEDEFGVLVPEGATSAQDRAGRIVDRLRTPVPTGPAGGAPLVVRAWAGVAELETGRDARDILRRAGAALQTATEGGRGPVVVLDGLSVSTSAERLRLTGEVVDAAGRGELDVVFQPDVDLADGRMIGVEALVRWRRREGFSAPTETFVRLAEEVGAVRVVDDWVMEASLGQLGSWRRELGARHLELGLNVSALSLTADLPERLLDCCRRNDVPPECLRLEVTETALADDSRASEVLRRVRQLGCRVALDDFGTGYATLSRLHRLPVDVLKLDRSFLPNLTRDPASRALVSLVLGLAGPLRVDVVAEGVETFGQRDVLVGLGCRRAQGFLFARPAPAAAIVRLLREDAPLVPGGSLSVGP